MQRQSSPPSKKKAYFPEKGNRLSTSNEKAGALQTNRLFIDQHVSSATRLSFADPRLCAPRSLGVYLFGNYTLSLQISNILNKCYSAFVNALIVPEDTKYRA